MRGSSRLRRYPRGNATNLSAGLLYFPYDKKLKTIRTVDLLVDDQVIKLR